MRSLRIDRSYRAIVDAPPRGNVFTLLWADTHDEAYRWAARHRCGVNPATGAMQVFQPERAIPPRVPDQKLPTTPSSLGAIRSTEDPSTGAAWRTHGTRKGGADLARGGRPQSQ